MSLSNMEHLSEDLVSSKCQQRGFSTMEKTLAVLFALMTVASVGLVVLYFVDREAHHEDNGAAGLTDSGCGSPMHQNGPSGVISSMKYPTEYENDARCSWVITVDVDQVVLLWFEDISLEDTSPCAEDSITVTDSLGLLGRFCGNLKPKPVASLGNTLLISFRSDEKQTARGFKASYKAVEPDMIAEIVGAGGVIQGDRGQLLTPGFPAKNYEDNVLYQWKISVAADGRVKLVFDSFDLVPASCLDYVDIFDGHLEGSRLLGRFCGSTKPPILLSTGNTMVVRFISDASDTAKGFSATFSLYLPPLPPASTPASMTSVPPTVDSGCDSSLLQFGRRGVIHSKNYPGAYPTDLRCSWNITVQQGLLVRLTVTDLAVVGDAGQCKGDWLEVLDDLDQLGSHCGYAPPPVLLSYSNRLSLKFQSDQQLSDHGFSAIWEAIHPEDIEEIQGCGGYFDTEVGVMKSANWPLKYPGNRMCTWILNVPTGKRITLNFTYFDLEEQDPFTKKCFDNLVVFDVASYGTRKYGPYCGNQWPPAILSAENKLVVRFHSDLFTEETGFRAFWTTDPLSPAPTEEAPQPNPWDDIPIEWPSECGKPAITPQVNTRIVNGEPARAHSWPWQVSMQVWPASQNEMIFFHNCGGTLIHKSWVLTAAHCFIRYADELHRWRMCLGKHNLTVEEPSERCYGVLGIYRHEAFQYPEVPTVEYDIALVRLDGEVTASAHISFACLPPADEVLALGRMCYATGWGDETGNSLAPKVAESLNQVALPVIPFETCKRVDYWWFQVKRSMTCAGYTLPNDLKSVCQGDSGGPFVCQSNNSLWEVHGITSFGPIGCVMNKKPSVFTRTSAYHNWMEQIIKKNIYDQKSSGCGGAKDLDGSSGSIASMGHPLYYSNNGSCTWHIQVPTGKLVHLQFSNFSLEDSVMCVNDRLSVSDGIGTLGVHCSSNKPADVISIGSLLTVTFKSNDKIVDTGFLALWKAVDPSAAPNIAGCGGFFTSNQGEFTSPGWPNGTYPTNKICTWHISRDPAETIHVTFTDFELQGANLLGRCVDYVDVYDGDGENAQKLGHFCGITIPPALSSNSSTVVIRFFSGSDGVKKGFRGYWTTNPQPKAVQPWDSISIDWPKDCGIPHVSPYTSALKIVNGEKAIPNSWPWQASLQIRLLPIFPVQHSCGGSLIHEEWLLTAAHCFAQMPNTKLWRVCLGKHNMTALEPTEQCVGIDAIIRHENFLYPDFKDMANDIALVHFSSKVNMTQEISPICLPSATASLQEGEMCYATGWGDEKGSTFLYVSKTLNQAALPIIPYDTCSKPEYWADKVHPCMICAGYESPDELKSICQGDSGGPLACPSSFNRKLWEVQGIASFTENGCMVEKKPSVFTRVSFYIDWIEDNIKKFIYNKTASSQP
ncbi:ovochymase-2 [Erpetoichthys calabaricus]|uniref:ovochymase-2 n=1 Tax=Erpetoichthys calabaricus TaxID=27687 RepID=UPI002234777D|nr:ovochymase-2 [Erpetoichthys calabaricus]